MKCPRCGSENVNVQMVSEQVVRTYDHSLFYKLFFGWWMWFFKFLLKLCFSMFTFFLPKKNKTTFTEHKTMAVCQKCGHTWQV